MRFSFLFRRAKAKAGALRAWVAVLAAAVTIGGALSSGAATPALASPGAAAAPASHPTKRVCAQPSSSKAAACLAVQRTDVTPHLAGAPNVTPSGYGPAQLQSAYALPSATAGAGQTVAIVDAYDDPNAEADLATYRSQYGLPSCTTANGCFRKVDQRGAGAYPAPNSGWSTEISLDLDMVSAVCPNCGILLVEADDNSIDNLAAAVDEAVALGARYVSNSYATSGEDPSEAGYDVHYHHPGVAITASSGDAGYQVNYPAASPYVTAVGGTSLVKDSSARGWSETAWDGAGSGCSQFEAKPAWQSDTGCAKRTSTDVSAVADPNTGVAVYDSYQYGGWAVFGGTSVASPIVASVYALAGPPAADTVPASYPYDSQVVGPGGLNDVTSGSNGSCSPAYLCTGETGYDGPTGLGSPAGVAAFVYRDHGDIAGTVTDAVTGKPLAGVQVGVPGRAATTDSQGHYDLNLPVSRYPVTANLHLYQPQTVSVTITAGATSAVDFALTPTPRVALTGTVTDGSGHGWALYAKVTASDGITTFTAFTDPATGRYTLALPYNSEYNLHVAAGVSGYDPADTHLVVGATDLSHDVALTVSLTCDAPGYRVTLTGSTQAFDATTAPKGWAVANVDHHLPGYSGTPGWTFTNPGGRTNATGGTGNFAVVDSDNAGQHSVQDTYLTSPAFNLTAATTPAVQFANDLHPAVNSTATVEASLDGGSTWSTVWRNTGFPGAPGPNTQVVPLPQAAGKPTVKIRFHYTGNWSQWWAIDNVFLGNRTCTRVSGGLVVGRVTDVATGAGITGATVASAANPDQQAITVSTPDDTSLGGGFYTLFATATGAQQITAAAANHNPTTSSTTVTADQTARLDLSLTPNP